MPELAVEVRGPARRPARASPGESRAGRWCALAGLLVPLLCLPAFAQEPAGHALGKVHFPISRSPAVQARFDHAVALLHHMMYEESRQAFEAVARLDSRCSMAYWGTAMTLFQPLWPARPGPEALERGWDLVQTAKRLQPATDRERAFVTAAEAFYREPPRETATTRLMAGSRSSRRARKNEVMGEPSASS